MTLRAACIQLNSGPDVAANIAKIETFVARAASQGASFIALPENAFHLDTPDAKRVLYAHENHPGLKACTQLAKKHRCWLLAGTAAVRAGDSGKAANRSVLFDDQGREAAHYDKIHLFDAEVGDGQRYMESERIAPGSRGVVAQAPWGRVGLTVCYDLRFGYLFRQLAKKGADIISVPAAFTVPTGEAHWHVLLRARAIENGCFILAPAQCGLHPGGRRTYGHTLMIDPWGKILGELGDEEGVLTVNLDLAMVANTRRKLPSLSHDRDFSFDPGI